MNPTQTPDPGTHLLLYAGDVLVFTLQTELSGGKAFLRTNLGNGAVRRAETISMVEAGVASPGQDWHDIPMQPVGNGRFQLHLALLETGHFEAKAFYLSENADHTFWPDGPNVHVNVGPAGFCCANSIYCAFIRQFGPNKAKTASALPDAVNGHCLSLLDQARYTVIPPSGTFRDLIRELDHIFDRLKCRIIHLLPVNPTPTVYARMGRFGSPYASLSFTAVNPELAEFDRSATPLEQFLELVDAIHARNGKLFIDIAVNHTGWASEIHERHPEWLVRKPDREIVSPGAWGTVWEDLTELDYSNQDLWKYIADVFIEWCRRGVDGFRCDAGYMIPVPAWEYIIARVRNVAPDIVFLLEGLGGDPAVTTQLLDYANMNWAYSELFQNYSKEQIEGYLHYAWKESHGNGIMVNYAETHDNSRLAAVSEVYAKMRTGLAALTSVNGAFGFANGVEWFAKEKIDVHEARALSWGNPANQVEFIGRLNALLMTHPAFHNGALLDILTTDSPDAVLLLRTDSAGERMVLVAVNLNCEKSVVAHWRPKHSFHSGSMTLHDILSKRTIPLNMDTGSFSIQLGPGEVLCSSGNPSDVELVDRALATPLDRNGKTAFQEAMAMALRTLCCMRGTDELLPEENPSELARLMLKSPESFLRTLACPEAPTPFVLWEGPSDTRRCVMVPPGHFLLMFSDSHFRALLMVGGKPIQQYDSLLDEQGRSFAIFRPIATELPHKHAFLRIASQTADGRILRCDAPLLLLAPDIHETMHSYDHRHIRKTPLTFLQANGRGAISHLRLDQPEISSRYDAILLANLNGDHPEDRHIMFRRIRMWLLHHARQQEISLCCLDDFQTAEDGSGLWNYHIPTGNGLYADLTLKIQLIRDRNQVRLSLYRHSEKTSVSLIPDSSQVKLICRMDLEDRNFHYSTKARDVENIWPGKVVNLDRGFDFTPVPGRIFSMRSATGRFCRADEWTYMLWEQNEANRGLDPHCDVYSPGYFEIPLSGGEMTEMTASVLTPAEPSCLLPSKLTRSDFTALRDHSMERTMLDGMRSFIVKRDRLKTVIAGYPWFLDWGRDTLIAARGLLCAPEFRADVKAILTQFALYADHGTIPNIIHGNDVGNRDTSDAPLWLFVATSDLCREEGSRDFLKTPVRDRETMLDVLISIAEGILSGTPNGIRMDRDSGLIFSPPHFTWMDTNYPAGTPREGYPIEIQALWYSALRFLSEAAPDGGKWLALAEKVKDSVLHLYPSGNGSYLSDCLHCHAGIPARDAIPDDHIRPNQLFAITLGVVSDPLFARKILEVCSCLLIPGALRSLADRPTTYPLPIVSSTGVLLNNPSAPYWGRYEGDEDTRRKPSYHNGTAWTWPFPSYCEAYAMSFGAEGEATARSLLSSSEIIMHQGCVGQLTEILDGDYPHSQRGCDAQAWSMTELYRVWKKLHPGE